METTTTADLSKDWNAPRVLALLGESERSDLEFKRGPAIHWSDGAGRDRRLDELSKDVTGMANAAGGVIIYGIEETDGVASGVDGVDSAHMDPERLENVILDNIRPALPDLRITPVLIEDKVVYVLEVPRSVAGNQARDGKYYRRRNRRVDTLEDWELRELMHRSVRADAEVILRSETLDDGGGFKHTCLLRAAIRNNGAIRIRDWKVVLDVPSEYLTTPADGIEINVRKGAHGYLALRFSQDTTRIVPIFPSEEVEVFSLQYMVNDRLHDREDSVPLSVDWALYADDMPPRSGSKRMRELHNF